MRVLIFTAHISPYHDARYVGAKSYIDDLHVVSVLNEGDFPQFLAESVGSYRLHRLYKSKADYTKEVAAGKLKRRVHNLLTELNPELVVVSGWANPESIIAIGYAFGAGIPVVLMSESQADDSRRSPLREWVKKQLVSTVSAALVGGPSHRDYLVSLGLSKDSIFLGYNAVDNVHFQSNLSKSRSAMESMGTELPTHYILASARFIPKKNLDTLIRAYGDALTKCSNIPDLVILGDGQERRRIEETIHESDLANRVHLLGFQGYQALPYLYGTASAFIHVSTSEQWGLVINEAMAASLPVIASEACGATRTMITDGINGLVCAPDVESISNAVVRLFNMSDEQRAMMGEAALLKVRDWGPDRFGSGLKSAVDYANSTKKHRKLAAVSRVIMFFLQRSIFDDVA